VRLPVIPRHQAHRRLLRHVNRSAEGTIAVAGQGVVRRAIGKTEKDGAIRRIVIRLAVFIDRQQAGVCCLGAAALHHHEGRHDIGRVGIAGGHEQTVVEGPVKTQARAAVKERCAVARSAASAHGGHKLSAGLISPARDLA